ncbi:MAG: fumarylacetoacetate hydrolase family protein, partial [Betaproteobacteria bacterium]|nr:fumarylacetoacetate hydrolase family protein [Betaproteobacteria bacterium]
MKLVTFEIHGGARHIGALLAGGQTLVDFTASDRAPHLGDMLALIDGGDAALAQARELAARPRVVRKLAEVKLLAPVPEPRQMRDFLIFEQHLRQARATRNRLAADGQPTDPAQIKLPRVWYEEPIYYKCNRFTVVGTGADVVMPSYTQQLDYELEFGFFLGRRGKNIR